MSSFGLNRCGEFCLRSGSEQVWWAAIWSIWWPNHVCYCISA